jgi:hypothetical protein
VDFSSFSEYAGHRVESERVMGLAVLLELSNRSTFRRSCGIQRAYRSTQ